MDHIWTCSKGLSSLGSDAWVPGQTDSIFQIKAVGGYCDLWQRSLLRAEQAEMLPELMTRNQEIHDPKFICRCFVIISNFQVQGYVCRFVIQVNCVLQGSGVQIILPPRQQSTLSTFEVSGRKMWYLFLKRLLIKMLMYMFGALYFKTTFRFIFSILLSQ